MSIPPSPYMQQQTAQQPEMMAGKVPVWDAGFRTYDSGIQSGVLSGNGSMAPSVLSGVSSMHGELVAGFEDPYAQYTPMHDQVDDMNARYEETRSHRIREAMFPETLPDEGMAMPTTQYDMGQSTNVQRLTEPSQMLKTAVANLINYQDDAELATRAVPELIKLLSDEDQVVVGHAAMMVHQLTKRESSRHALIRTPQLIEAVVKTMNQTNDQEISKHVTGALYNMSQHPQGLMSIFRTGGIRALVRLLGSPVEAVVYYAITTLHNLLMHQEGAKDEVRNANGIEMMVPLLDVRQEKFLAILTDCLHHLTSNHEESKLIVLNYGGTPKLVEIMRTYNYEKLLYTTSRVIKVLSVCPKNKTAIVQAGGMQAIQRHLNHPSQRLVKNCLWALRNLSDAATKEENIGDLLISLVQLLGSSDADIVTCCAGVLSNLTCNNQRNKHALCVAHGIEALIRTLEAHRENWEITEPGLCALRHLTSRHDMSTMAQNNVRMVNGIPIICELMATMRPPVLKASLGLVRNLATCEANYAPLRDVRASNGKGIVQLTSESLTNAFSAVREAQLQGKPSMVIHGVNMLELVQCSTAVLHQLSHDVVSRSQIRDTPNLIPIFVNLLNYEDEEIQRAATSVLSQLVRDPDAAKMIEREGATPALTELLHSRNEAISSYSASVLYHLGSDKPPDYRENLDRQVASALYRDDSAAWAGDGVGEMSEDIMFDDMQAGMYPNQGPYDPSLGMDQMHLGSPWAGPDGQGGMYQQPLQGAPPPHQQPNMAGGWYDTDL